MRRAIAIASVALGIALIAASSAFAGGYAGFRAGVNMASFSGADGVFDPEPGSPYPAIAFPPTEYPDPRNGFTGAVFIGVDNGRYGFQTDIMYTMKGATNGEASIKVDYVELAPLFVYRQSLSGRYSLRLLAGPVFGLFVNAEVDNGPMDLDLGDMTKHLEVSGTLGLELGVAAGPYVVLLDGRYTQGTRVFKEEDLSGGTTDYYAHNAGIAVSAGLMVPF